MDVGHDGRDKDDEKKTRYRNKLGLSMGFTFYIIYHSLFRFIFISAAHTSAYPPSCIQHIPPSYIYHPSCIHSTILHSSHQTYIRHTSDIHPRHTSDNNLWNDRLLSVTSGGTTQQEKRFNTRMMNNIRDRNILQPVGYLRSYPNNWLEILLSLFVCIMITSTC